MMIPRALYPESLIYSRVACRLKSNRMFAFLQKIVACSVSFRGLGLEKYELVRISTFTELCDERLLTAKKEKEW